MMLAIPIERVIVVANSSVTHNDAYAAERIALALGGRRVGNHWEARCPAHDDRHPSFHIAYKDNKVLVKCWGGCSQESVIETLQERGLWGEGAHVITSKLVGQFDTSHGLKVEQLAEHKGLPMDILLGFGLTTITRNCRSVVRIPYPRLSIAVTGHCHGFSTVLTGQRRYWAGPTTIHGNAARVGAPEI